jgi:predicted PurR-regulated permease PerM
MPSHNESVFVRRVLIATGIVVGAAALVAVVVALPQALLLFFAAILAAMALDSLADPLEHWLRLPRWLALLLGMTLVVAALGLVVLFSGGQLVEQATNLVDRAPAALERLEELLLSFPLSRQLLNGQPPEASGWFPMVGTAWRSLLGTFTSSLSVLGTSAVLVIMAFFLALDPRTYIDAFVRVVPPQRRPRVEQILVNMGSALRWWLVGRLIAMAAVSVLTFVSLTLLGVPVALLLSLLAGILTFIPYVGPILAAIPALVVALSQDPTLALWIPLIYSVIQGLENNLLTPLIQARTADIPPAYAIAAQFVIGVPFGLLGLALATPLLIVIVILVQMAYIEDVLGERVQVLGADSERDAEPLGGVAGEEAMLHGGRGVRE